MTTFPRSPRTLKGALVSIDFLSLMPLEIIPFQFNPHTVTRSFELKPSTAGAEAGQIGSAPAESIKLELELDSAEDTDAPDVREGVQHRLSALENLVTPSSKVVITNLVLLNVGTIEIVPPTTRLVLFIWGPKRVLPVVVTELSITEEGFDIDLTPTVARVSIGLRVLNWDDVGQMHPAFGIAMSQQMQKEALSTLATVRSLESILGITNLAL